MTGIKERNDYKMNKISKLLISGLISVSVFMPTFAYAAEFSDMPDNWTTGALERAVENGLLNGADGKIMPDDNITRAQMAAIIVRAFGADKESDISAFSDVSADKWYYSEFAKAVNMNAFGGTDDGKLNPDNFITYEECFTVVSRVFGLRAIVNDAGEEVFDSLDKFSDSDMVHDWAKTYMSKVVGNGYWDGIDNKLKPRDYITRAEFAVLMDNMVQSYITTPGEYTEIPDGNVLIKTDGVTLKDITTDNMIIIGDGVKGDTTLDNITSTSQISVRGGTAKVTGTINHISALCPEVNVDISGVTKRTGKVYLCKDSHLFMGTLY